MCDSIYLLTKVHSPYSRAGPDIEDMLGVLDGRKIQLAIQRQQEEVMLKIYVKY
jgi:hypothetical protein